MNYRCYGHFPGLELFISASKGGDLTLKDEDMVEFSKYSTFWEMMLEG